MKLEVIYRPIAADLAAVKNNLRQKTNEDKGVTGSLAGDLLTAPGKLLRPALVLFSARVGGRNHQAAVELASAVEILHLASLVQDDAIDRAQLRRGQQSIQRRWGKETAILFGDYLFARAFGLLTQLKDFRLLNSLLGVARLMAVGELEQVGRKGQIFSAAGYLAVIEKKTAVLFAACCETGAIVGGAKPTQVAALKEFGRNFGLAFQIIDDCLDGNPIDRAKARAAGYLASAKTSLAGAIPAPKQNVFFNLSDFVLAQAPGHV